MKFKVNVWAVICAALAVALVGAIWYGVFFGAVWMEQWGIATDDISPLSNLAVVLGEIVYGIVLSVILFKTGLFSASAGVKYSLLLALGVAVPGIVVNAVLFRISITVILIDVGYILIAKTFLGLIIGAWKPKGAQ